MTYAIVRTTIFSLLLLLALPLVAQDTPLPIIKITTTEDIVDEPKVDGEIAIIWNGAGNRNNPDDEPNEYTGNIGIEIRGQTSKNFPKKGYGFETRDADGADIDTSFLGFPTEEDWVLHGPFSDKSLLRNVVAMHIARSVDTYASRTRPVELYLNDEYRGVYILMERIKRDEKRVDVARLKPTDTEGEELTGGYIFKIDKGRPDWTSQYSPINNPTAKLAFQYLYPRRENIAPQQASYLRAYVDSFENALIAPDLTYAGKYYTEYMDVNSFVSQFIINEAAKNIDAYRISSYFHKKKITNGGLLHAGPAWDYNLAFGNADYCDGEDPEGFMYPIHCDEGNPFWWGKLLESDDFTDPLACRWIEVRSGALHTDSLFQFIDDQVESMGPAVGRNFDRWDILGENIWPNPVFPATYGEEITNLKRFIAMRMDWLDLNMPGACTISPTSVPVVEAFGILVNPNPAADEIRVTSSADFIGPYELALLNSFGQRLLSRRGTQSGGVLDLKLNLTTLGLPTGVYALRLSSGGRVITTEKVVLK